MGRTLGCVVNANNAILGSQVVRSFGMALTPYLPTPGPGCQVSPLVACLLAYARCPLSLSIVSESDRPIDCYTARSVVTSLSPIIIDHIYSSSSVVGMPAHQARLRVFVKSQCGSG